MIGRPVQIVKINDEDAEHSFTLGKAEICIFLLYDFLTPSPPPAYQFCTCISYVKQG